MKRTSIADVMSAPVQHPVVDKNFDNRGNYQSENGDTRTDMTLNSYLDAHTNRSDICAHEFNKQFSNESTDIRDSEGGGISRSNSIGGDFEFSAPLTQPAIINMDASTRNVSQAENGDVDVEVNLNEYFNAYTNSSDVNTAVFNKQFSNESADIRENDETGSKMKRTSIADVMSAPVQHPVVDKNFDNHGNDQSENGDTRTDMTLNSYFDAHTNRSDICAHEFNKQFSNESTDIRDSEGGGIPRSNSIGGDFEFSAPLNQHGVGDSNYARNLSVTDIAVPNEINEDDVSVISIRSAIGGKVVDNTNANTISATSLMLAAASRSTSDVEERLPSGRKSGASSGGHPESDSIGSASVLPPLPSDLFRQATDLQDLPESARQNETTYNKFMAVDIISHKSAWLFHLIDRNSDASLSLTEFILALADQPLVSMV
jgi:hypothetical protein